MKLLKLIVSIFLLVIVSFPELQAQKLPKPKATVHIFPRNQTDFESYLYRFTNETVYYAPSKSDSVSSIGLSEIDSLKVREFGRGLDYALGGFYVSSPLLLIPNDGYIPNYVFTLPVIGIATATGALVGSLFNVRIDIDSDVPLKKWDLRRIEKLNVITQNQANRYLVTQNLQVQYEKEKQVKDSIAVKKFREKMSGYSISVGIYKVPNHNQSIRNTLDNLGFQHDGSVLNGSVGRTLEFAKAVNNNVALFTGLALLGGYSGKSYHSVNGDKQNDYSYSLNLIHNQLVAGGTYTLYPFQKAENAKFGLTAGAGAALSAVYLAYRVSYSQEKFNFYIRPGINLRTGAELFTGDKLGFGVFYNYYVYPKVKVKEFNYSANGEQFTMPEHKFSTQLQYYSLTLSYKF